MTIHLRRSASSAVANGKRAAQQAQPEPEARKKAKSRSKRRRGSLEPTPASAVALAIGVAFLGVAAIAALAYRYFHRSTPPAGGGADGHGDRSQRGIPAPRPRTIAKQDGLRGNYVEESVRSKYLNPAEYGGKEAKNLEGFLFPDTFELEKHAKAADLVQLQLEDFKRRIAGVDMSYAHSKNLTIYDVVTSPR